MRFGMHTAACIAVSVLLTCAPLVSSAQPPHDKNTTWNYDGGVLLISDGSIPNGPCFRISGRVTAPDFFDNLKRFDDDHGTVFRRGKDTLTDFPGEVILAFVVFDRPCPDQMERTGTRPYLTRALMGSLKLYLYWKRGLDLRPVEDVKPKYFSVDPIIPYAAAKAHDLPEKFEWAYEFLVPSAGVPLTDSLVLILRTADGHMAARVAARL